MEVPLGQPLTVSITSTTTQVFFDNAISVNSDGSWSVTVPPSILQGLSDGQYFINAYDYPALVADGQTGNVVTGGNPVVQTVTVEEHTQPLPTLTLAPFGPLSAGSIINANGGFHPSGAETGLNGDTMTVQMSDSSGNAIGPPLTTVGQANGDWIFQVSDQFLLDNVTQPTNSLTFTANGTNANGTATVSETSQISPNYEAPSAQIQAFTPADLNLLADLGRASIHC